MESGCSVRFGQFSPDATSCRTQRWKSLWPTEVSGSANYRIWNSRLPSSLRNMSFIRSVGHVQLSRPGHGKENGLQPSSSGSGYQLWTPPSQVGHIRERELDINKYSSWPLLTPLCCVLGPLCRLSLQPAVIRSPIALVVEVDVQ